MSFFDSYQDVQHHYEDHPGACEHGALGGCIECDLAALQRQLAQAEEEIGTLQSLLANLFRDATGKTLMTTWQYAASAYLKSHGLVS